MSDLLSKLDPPQRVLMGPGPSDVPARILNALAAPTIGHLDPAYLQLMDQTRQLMRQVFQTENEMTLAISGTGSAGMEACVTNLIERGDRMIACVSGVFGGRMADVAGRYGASVDLVEVPWGEAIRPEQVEAALKAAPQTKAVGIVQAETSTGLLQPLDEIAEIVHAHDALLVVDAVTSLGGMEVPVDRLGIDACFSGTQKNLSCPPGLAPVTFSQRAVEIMDRRKSKVGSWYLDLSMIRNYWGSDRSYHHTAPINMTYALREALQIIVEEGLVARFERHQAMHRRLRAGLEALGLTYIPQHSLPNLNCVRVPDGVDDAAVRRQLLTEYGIEIGAGLGPFKGTAWRIGLMGHSCTARNVTLILAALETILRQSGSLIEPGSALAAAAQASDA
ncbi:Purine catabolism protein PucG [Rosistilla carotiformis]|uniref:Purine catabolism protein PucG n=1 Tax=Rosistilla carotiformis TaxID=2528017 RepID=A0A518K175_9BACT|nr:alanine--glyoxylate aminotransferase family protein [Rosistilla carotiformis]QDV71550.1 Purine catabolism protein PucG [Rosistilla carotiformis]